MVMENITFKMGIWINLMRLFCKSKKQRLVVISGRIWSEINTLPYKLGDNQNLHNY